MSGISRVGGVFFLLLSTLCKLLFEVEVPEEFMWHLHLFTQKGFIIGYSVLYLLCWLLRGLLCLHVFVYWSLHAILKFSTLQKGIFCEKRTLSSGLKCNRSGRVELNDLWYGPGSGFNLKRVQTSADADYKCWEKSCDPIKNNTRIWSKKMVWKLW